jgi:triosephosphate isomerase (TIM)
VTTPLIIGNWKMNMLVSEACYLARSLLEKSVEEVDVIIAPPFTSLYPVSQIVSGSRLGMAAQNFYSKNKGAYTGEISLEMIKDVGCSYVLIGHSERRQLFSETDDEINKKIHRAIQLGITAVVCVGETREQREAGNTLNVIEDQLSKGLVGLSGDSIARIVIAYEPIWAIGTGVNASPEEAAETHKFIRKFLFDSQMFSRNIRARIIYGGSVTVKNCKKLFYEEEIDGALIGGASLNFESFYAIIKSSLER